MFQVTELVEKYTLFQLLLQNVKKCAAVTTLYITMMTRYKNSETFMVYASKFSSFRSQYLTFA